MLAHFSLCSVTLPGNKYTMCLECTLFIGHVIDNICSRFGPIFLDFSPHRVMYSGWVGDNDPTFEGLQYALKSYLQSAWASECYNSCVTP